MIVHIFMNTLPTSFESFIQSTIAQDVLPSFENLIGKLFLEKQRRKTNFDKQGGKEALMMQIRRTNGYNKHTNMKYRRKDQQLPNPQRYSQPQGRHGAMGFHDNNEGNFQKFPPRRLGHCNNCCQLGHWVRECPEL